MSDKIVNKKQQNTEGKSMPMYKGGAVSSRTSKKFKEK